MILIELAEVIWMGDKVHRLQGKRKGDTSEGGERRAEEEKTTNGPFSLPFQKNTHSVEWTHLITRSTRST